MNFAQKKWLVPLFREVQLLCNVLRHCQTLLTLVGGFWQQEPIQGISRENVEIPTANTYCFRAVELGIKLFGHTFRREDLIFG